MNFTAFEKWLAVTKKYARSSVYDTMLVVRRLATDCPARGILPRRNKPYITRLLAYAEDTGDAGALKIATWAQGCLPTKKRSDSLGGRQLAREDRGRVATAFDEESWAKLRMGLREDREPVARVLEVMTATSLRVSDVLRIPQKRLRDGLKHGVIQLVLKGGHTQARPVAGAADEWERLLEIFEDAPDAEDVAHAVSPEMRTDRNFGSTGAYQAVRRALLRHCKAAGLTEEVWTHRIRRTVLVHASIESGGDRLAIRDLGGQRGLRSQDTYLTESRGERIVKMQERLNQKGGS
jgi:hypothetical protein